MHENPGLTDGAMTALPKLKKLKVALFLEESLGSATLRCLRWPKSKSLENLTLTSRAARKRGARKLKRRLKNCEIIFNYKKIE